MSAESGRQMTYGEYRNRFETVGDFMRAYGKLPEDEVRALIDSGDSPGFIKACMFTAWRRAKEEAEDDSSLDSDCISF